VNIDASKRILVGNKEHAMVAAEIVTNQHEWAVVTGASSGIGRAFALELARRGHPILLVARRGYELQRVAAEITAGGGRAEPLVVDLASAGGVDVVARAAEALGDIGVLVNNAGAGSYGPFLEQPVGRDAAQVALNIDLRRDEGLRPLLQRGARPRAAGHGRARPRGQPGCREDRVLAGGGLARRGERAPQAHARRRRAGDTPGSGVRPRRARRGARLPAARRARRDHAASPDAVDDGANLRSAGAGAEAAAPAHLM